MKTVRDFICVMIIFALLSGLCVCLATSEAELAGDDSSLLSDTISKIASVQEELSADICTSHSAYTTVQSSFGLSEAA